MGIDRICLQIHLYKMEYFRECSVRWECFFPLFTFFFFLLHPFSLFVRLFRYIKPDSKKKREGMEILRWCKREQVKKKEAGKEKTGRSLTSRIAFYEPYIGLRRD